MDSLKITKGGKSSSSNVPLAIRFNAEEESIEEFIKPTTTNEPSILSSPQQGLEDFSWKTIQGNFFNRNRSGSIEGISTATNLLSSSDTNTIGTWKLIKGKVSQAMEDIKSSKSVQISSKNETTNNDDSDQDTSNVNISITDELLPSQTSIIPKLKLVTPSSLPSTAATTVTSTADSDSDLDIEPTVTDDIQSTSSALSFRKSLANLRSKSYIKSKVRSSTTKNKQPSPTSSATTISVSSQQQQNRNLLKKDDSPSSRFSSSFPSTKAETFLKMRRKLDKDNTNKISSNLDKKKDNEIESGIEVSEDMVILTTNENFSDQQQQQQNYHDDDNDSINIGNESGIGSILGMSIPDETITFKHRPKLNTITDNVLKNDPLEYFINSNKRSSNLNLLSATQQEKLQMEQQHQHKQSQIKFLEIFYLFLKNLSKRFSVCATFILLLSIIILPLPGFFCGVFTCLFTISLISCITDYFKILITNNTEQQNNYDDFKSINYNFSLFNDDEKFNRMRMMQNVCEIPAAEEHLSLKSYSGWMNEINNYDPANHHLSMTTPVFVKLSGSTLILSNTSARIPKRAMWNETTIDKDNITFTRTRYFNLLDCRVEMCPKGLARKRHFSRKYPIQLIIKNSNSTDKSHLRLSSSSVEQQQQSNEIQTDKTQQKQELNRNSFCNDDGINLKVTSTTIGGGSGSTDIVTEIKRHSINESYEDLSDRSYNTERNSSSGAFDFGNVISTSDLQKLQNNYEIVSKESVPCGDETRLLLFARCDREKEDWYRRFNAASQGLTFDQQEHIPDIVMFTDDEIAVAIKATAAALSEPEDTSSSAVVIETKTKSKSHENSTDTDKESRKSSNDDCSQYDGMLIASCALRNPPDFIRFMAKYQKACFQSSNNSPASTTNKVSPTITTTTTTDNNANKRNRRQKSKEDDLWKGIDQTIFKQQSGNVVWFNILIGRILYNCLNNKELLDRIQEFLQRKLSAIRLPSFMEDVIIDELDLGDTPPLIHRISQPILDERGTWIDADISYEGLMHMTITTKLNLLRLKRQQNQEFVDSTINSTLDSASGGTAASMNLSSSPNNAYTSKNSGLNSSPPKNDSNNTATFINSAIYDSDAESTGASSSESESQALGTIDPSAEPHSTFYTTPGSSRRLLRIVDRITASNLFQSATEISYIQRAMENMSTKITLKVELKGLVSRIVVNIPPPPSDRVWLAFRGPPRLWISAKPTVGEHAFDWSIVTTIIENKLCDEVYKYLVYPNMVDVIVPILGQPTYKEEN